MLDTMKVKVPASPVATVTAPNPNPSFECAIPEWLQTCLISRQTESDAPKPGTSAADSDLICRAFEFAYKLHEGQRRASGEPYICHPVAVAGLLRELGGGGISIAAGFLHDVVEDTEVTVEEIEQMFGAEVRHLVEGVTKLSKFNFSSKRERQAENFRRMFLAMAQDIRVIVVKLADRLHNMRTLEHLPDEKRRAIALETKEIFAPLANRLGIGRFKWELEDLSFKYLEPDAYRIIQDLVAEKRTDRETKLAEVVEIIRQRIDLASIDCLEISGRPKHLYGIYQKMQKRQKEFYQVYDISAIRIIVQNNEECYRTLAIVHDAFKPIPGRFKDYIGLPKPNCYQSLHTGVIGVTGHPIEIQIRTIEMHRIAEYGIAAHWKYKETGSSQVKLNNNDEKFTWLRQLLEWQNDLKDAQEYLQSIKDDLFDDDVYVFTPQGDVISLNRGATPVDFAYRIHTEVGNHCAGAKQNGRMVPLDTPLKNGDIVEIITHKNSRPSLDWLNFTVTPSAHNRIRQWYKRSHRDENIARGRELLEKEMGKSGFEALLKSDPMRSVAERCNYQNVEDLLAALGYGEITLKLVMNRWREAVRKSVQSSVTTTLDKELNTGSSIIGSSEEKSTTQPSHDNTEHPIAGIEGLLYYRAGCCNPIPGEAITGAVTRGRGIAIHRQGCHNLENVMGERLIPVSWNPINNKGFRLPTYSVNIQIEVIDRVGIFKDILSRLSDNNINVRNGQVKTSASKPAIIKLCIEVIDCEQLEKICFQIKKISDVLNLKRINQAQED